MPNQNNEATSAELREFLSQMRGKSPKEMLGAIASSNLAHSTLSATVTISAAIAIFTIVPFGLEKFSANPAPTQTSPPEAQSTDKPLPTPAEPKLDGSSPRETADRLGIGESRTAPANVNPLESSTDNLLEGLE